MSNATELLRRAYEALDRFAIYDDLRDSIEDFLAVETEAEPVAWVKITECGDRRLSLECMDKHYKPLYTRPESEAEPVAYIYKGFGVRSLNFITDDLKPHLHGEEISLLYLHPPRPEPARKPMTEEEMRKGSGEWAHLHNIFEEGIRFAEKHHGIDGNPSETISNQRFDKSDPDSIDLQSRCRGDKI